MEKSFGGLVFRSILIFFSCVLLVFSMLSTVRLAEMNDRLMETEKGIEELSVKNDVLLAQYESSMGLDEIEKYATERLGMQKSAPGQIIYLDAPESLDRG